jgi:hypothetical protein
MARTIPEIFDAMVAEKATLATLAPLLENSSSTATTPYKRLLADINSSSKVSPWRLFLFIVAVAAWVLENLWDIFRTEINEKAEQAISGNIPWYKRQVLAFQYLYDLQLIDNVYKYVTLDEAAQIIKRVAIVEADDGKLRIKIAKLNATGLPIPLTLAEKNAFLAYISKVKFAGTPILIINDAADDLRFNLNVYFNPLIGVDAVIDNTEAAVSSYLANLEFNGAINVTRFIDALQAATGINDVLINSIEARYAALPYAIIDRQYIPNAGYLTVVGGLPLGSVTNNPDGTVTTTNAHGVTITYIPNV